MLPDFPDIKQIGHRRVREFIEQNIPQFAPILADIRHFRQHEGARRHITRVDASEGTLDYPETGFNFVLTRDEMKSLDMVGVIQKLRGLAEKFAEAQSKSMFETISAAAEAVGNVRKGVGELTAEAFAVSSAARHEHRQGNGCESLERADALRTVESVRRDREQRCPNRLTVQAAPLHSCKYRWLHAPATKIQGFWDRVVTDL